MTDKIDFSQFTVGSVLAHFMHNIENSLEYAAMHFMFAAMKDELLSPSFNQATLGKLASGLAIEKVEYRYDLFNEYGEDFFPIGPDFDLEALMIAAICDEYIEHAAPPEGAETYEPSSLYQFLDHDLVYRARQMWEEANGIMGMGIPEDMPVLYESVMLAHINGMQRLRDIDEDFELYDYDDLKDILERDLKPIAAFALAETRIGAVLIEMNNYMVEEVEKTLQSMEPLAPPAPKANHLRVIPVKDPAP